MTDLVDVLVIGGGPAGLSAATWLGRHRRHVVVLDAGNYRNRSVAESYGYFANDAVDPATLRCRARKDLERYSTVRVCSDSAEGARVLDGGTFEVDTTSGTLRSRAVVLATGVRDDLPDVDGLLECYGTSVFHCPHCDGFETKGKDVVVIGADEDAIDTASQLSEWASQVTVVARHEDDDPCPPHAQQVGVVVRATPARRLVMACGELASVEL